MTLIIAEKPKVHTIYSEICILGFVREIVDAQKNSFFKIKERL